MSTASASRRRRTGVLVFLLAAVAIIAVPLLPAGCGNDLAGTTWKASVLGNEVTLTFDDDETCTLEWGMPGMSTEKRSGPYVVEGDEVTVGKGDEKMVLTRSDDTMTGSAQGVTLTFERQ